MLDRLVMSLIVVAACAAPDATPFAGTGVTGLADVRCAGFPDAGPERELRHASSHVITALGEPHHRGIDLVVNDAAATQTIEGELGYTVADKALEDEDVDLFACDGGTWRAIGTARTDGEGHFALALAGAQRLAVGMRDMALSVAGDRTAARFLAVVAPAATELAVSDVDGTLTTSETALVGDVLGGDAAIHPGAAVGFQHLAERGFVPTYVTARPRLLTDATRAWLASKGLPRGPLVLAVGLVGPDEAAAFKTGALADLAAQLPIALGVGNRGSDLEAYANAGLPGNAVLIKLPEYADEVADAIAAGRATGFDAYPGPLATF